MSITQDRPCTCMFFFADGRRCQMPPSADDMGLCYFHAKKHRDHLNAQEAGQQINEFLSSDILTACDLTAALATLFSATALGLIKPKTTFALTALGNLMLQTQRLAKEEFLQSFDDRWPKIVQESIVFNEPATPTTPEAPAAQSTIPILTPANDTPSDNPTPIPPTTNPSPSPKSCRGGACPALLGYSCCWWHRHSCLRAFSKGTSSTPSEHANSKHFPTPSTSITFKPIQNKPLHPPAKSITFKKQGGGGVSNQLTLGTDRADG